MPGYKLLSSGFLAAIRYRWIVPSMKPFSSTVSCSFKSRSKQLSTEKPGNSHSMILANQTKAPISVKRIERNTSSA